MDDSAIEFLVKLLETPGVSGYEHPVQEVVRGYVSEFADEVHTDFHGNLIVCKNPDADTRIMLAGHADQIGLLVSQIDDSGMLFFQTVGGWDAQQLVGQTVTVWTDSGGIPGVVSRKAIHLLEENERKQVAKIKDMWIDIGAKGKADAESRVTIGDSVTLSLGMTRLQNNLVAAPAMDNRTGVWIVMEAMRLAAESGIPGGLYCVSTVQEEIGLRGAKTAAYGIDPQVGVAVDVTHATDLPGIDGRQQGNIELGGGPVIFRGPNVNRLVADRLRQQCTENEIPFQLAALGRAAPNDSNPLQVNRSGVATGLISVPNRYMHSAVETVSLDDLEHSARLLAQFCCSIADPSEFLP